MDEEEYEAQRQANIAANTALLQSLGLSKQVKVKSTIKRQTRVVVAPSERRLRSVSLSSASTNTTPSASPLKRKVTAKQEDEDDDQITHTEGRRSGRVRKSQIFFGNVSPYNYPMHKRHTRRRRHSDDSLVVKDDHSSGEDEADYKPKTRFKASNLDRMPLRAVQRLGERIQDPKQFGHIPGIAVGTWWNTRMECSTDAVHAPPVSGICGNIDVGCYSLALSGGYADDIDLGHSFTYTGSGGKKLSGMVNGKMLNLRTAPQAFDQSFADTCNAALLTSSLTKNPIRVIRGYKLDSQWAPSEGYLYSGLYVCTRAWLGDGLSGFKVCKYAFERLPDQDPLPIPGKESSEEDFNEDDEDDEDAVSASDGREVSQELDVARCPSVSSVKPRGWIVEVVIAKKRDKPSHYDYLHCLSR
ncbi:hypothetical protein CBS101457_000830 [Exobasidium rhododendri]|nr:hypothetical protein CBS101457_000830 [Exobasidium rhododendri]